MHSFCDYGLGSAFARSMSVLGALVLLMPHLDGQTATEAPPAPTLEQVAGIGQRKMRLGWQLLSPTASGVVVERSADTVGFSAVAQLPATATHWKTRKPGPWACPPWISPYFSV